MLAKRLIKSNDAGGGACTNTVDLYNPFPDGGGVALYQLNGDATDVSGNYDASTVNAITWGGAGVFGTSAAFNGSSSNFSIDATATTPIDFSSENFTISMWLNPSSLGSLNTILGKYSATADSPTTKRSINIRHTSSGEIQVTENDGSSIYIQLSTGTISANSWSFVSYVREAGSSHIYINNNSAETQSRTNTIKDGSIQPITIGGVRPDNAEFNGSIDQVRFFNRALRPYEVEALYTEEYCTPTIVPSEHFNTVTYTGNASTLPITGVGFEPDFVWIKQRSYADNHNLWDRVRGLNNYLITNSTSAALSKTNGVTSLDTDGFTLGNWDTANTSGQDYVAWNFKAGGAAVTNTDGTITSQVSANTEAGFSIVSYTGNQTNGATVGHGLGQKPDFIISKSRGNVNGWPVYHKSIGANQYLRLNETSQAISSVFPWNNTEPNSGVFTLNANDENNTSGQPIIAYCFAEVEGFSSFGSYVGTGTTSGNVVVTGFEPAFVMVKRTDAAGGSWLMVDNKRVAAGNEKHELFANTTTAESGTGYDVAFLENGFQMQTTTSNANASGGSYIYMAFAADPTAVEPTLEDSFNTVLYTGDDTDTSYTRDITGFGFQPDFVWIKDRDNGGFEHTLFDSVRGAGSSNVLSSNTTGVEGWTSAAPMSAFIDDGFSVQPRSPWNANNLVNKNGEDFVAWAWKGAEIPAINSNGSIPSVVSANPAAGFSIVSYTGNGNNYPTGASIGHGLDSQPKIIIVKDRTNTGTSWAVLPVAVSDSTAQTLLLDYDFALSSSGSANAFNQQLPTSSVFYVGQNSGGARTNGASSNYIAYCFAEVAGFSKFGSYTGTGSAGNAQTLGFEPAFIMFKLTSQASDWFILDNKRDTTNPRNNPLYPNLSNAEGSLGTGVNFLSNGFDFTGGSLNTTGVTFIYMAFANQF